ncbi:SIS domain-containing protein [Candidatus Enterococcus clewellii]|uniref:Glucoselysine-6-phosphate deglycase n=1 Tax=Candidatus Enterococcus clewellii TaxID=1834193 RepID=A0A242JXG3_9ENTE|nr:SIS domain-containing protein [Enterococcus sp. 9E7_DIV0242]OTP09809.1 hypothetical protein A5888_004005 [Enterococcus sp. 9E7_DIV0242]
MATMMDYIHEEKEVLEKIITAFQLVETQQAAKMKNCLILATGSSMNACMAAKYYMEKTAKITIDIQEPYHFLHYGRVNAAVDTVIAVSQSGKSASTIDAIKIINQEQKVRTLALTAVVDSPITAYVDEVIPLNMGIETVGFVTKGYSATVATLMLLSIAMANASGEITEEEVAGKKKDLFSAIETIPQIIEKTEAFFLTHEAEFRLAQRYISIGYGPNWGTAKEFETKFTETVRVPSSGFELEAYMHGPYLEADASHLLFFIENHSQQATRSQALNTYMRQAVGECLTITTEKSEEKNVLGLDMKVSEEISPLLLVVPFQLLAYRIATAKGIDLSQRIFDDFDDVLKSKR